MELTYRQVLSEKMKDPEFKKSWEAGEPEFQLIKSMIRAREKQNITQKQLAAKTGLTQTYISRIETGDADPTLQTLKKIAEGLGMKLELKMT